MLRFQLISGWDGLMIVVARSSRWKTGIILYLFYRKSFYYFNGEGISLESFWNGSWGKVLIVRGGGGGRKLVTLVRNGIENGLVKKITVKTGYCYLLDRQTWRRLKITLNDPVEVRGWNGFQVLVLFLFATRLCCCSEEWLSKLYQGEPSCV